MSALTALAQETIGLFVLKAGRRFLVVRAQDCFGNVRPLRITVDDVWRFYCTQLGSMSGIRVLAGLPGDHRPVSELARQAHLWFIRQGVL